MRSLALLAVVALVAACGGAGASPTAGPGVSVSAAWVRPPAGMDKPGAGYMIITNAGPQADALLGASSAAAMSVEVHETTTDASGMTGMHPVARVDVAAGATVELKPGGFHLMLMGLKDTVKVGDRIELKLRFERAGEIAVQAEVRQG